MIWTLIFWGIIWAMAPWLNRPDTEPIRNSWVLKGDPHGGSFPMWGYSALWRGLGSLDAVVVLQSFLGALATASLMVRLNSLLPHARKPTTVLFLISFPWLSFMAFPYQLPMSAILVCFALLVMEKCLRTGGIAWGVLAGALVGLAENFRAEWQLLLWFALLVVFLLRRLEAFKRLFLMPLVVGAATSFVLQLPWAFHCYFHAGRFSLAESNVGHVLYLSLGNVSGNPWHVIPRDAYAQLTVDKAGLNCSSLSFQGSDYLKRKFFEGVKEHPAGFVKVLAMRLFHTGFYPFNFIMITCTPAEKDKVRELLGFKNPPLITDRTAAEQTVSSANVAAMMVYTLVQGLIGVSVSLLGIAGFFLALRRGPFLLSQPLILCFSIVVTYRFALNVIITDGSVYMTSVYLLYLPFAVNSLSWLAQTRPGKFFLDLIKCNSMAETKNPGQLVLDVQNHPVSAD